MRSQDHFRTLFVCFCAHKIYLNVDRCDNGHWDASSLSSIRIIFGFESFLIKAALWQKAKSVEKLPSSKDFNNIFPFHWAVFCSSIWRITSFFSAHTNELIWNINEANKLQFVGFNCFDCEECGFSFLFRKQNLLT